MMTFDTKIPHCRILRIQTEWGNGHALSISAMTDRRAGTT